MKHAPYALLGDIVLAYGKTIKTACGKRRKVTDVVDRDKTDCPDCIAAIKADHEFMERCRKIADELAVQDLDR